MERGKLCGKKSGKGDVGQRRRPRQRWRDCIRTHLEVMGLREAARDRGVWRHAIHNGDPTSLRVKPGKEEKKKEEYDLNSFLKSVFDV